MLYTGGCRGRASSMCPAYGLMCKGMVVLAEQPVTGTMRHADAANAAAVAVLLLVRLIAEGRAKPVL